MHHAFVIEAEGEEGIRLAQEHAATQGLATLNNPDVIVLRYGLLSVDDARRMTAIASQAPLSGDTKALIIAASRAYHEAQNALLKVFEEPVPGTLLYLVLPSLGALLPTLRSRVQVLSLAKNSQKKTALPEEVETFLRAPKEKRSAFIKKLTSGKDEEERRENRDTALAIVNGVEAVAYQRLQKGEKNLAQLLGDISVLRGFLHERSAPVRMILEHLSLVTPARLKEDI